MEIYVICLSLINTRWFVDSVQILNFCSEVSSLEVFETTHRFGSVQFSTASVSCSVLNFVSPVRS